MCSQSAGIVPVLVVVRSFTIVVVNLHEAVLDDHLTDDLLPMDQQSVASQSCDNQLNQDSIVPGPPSASDDLCLSIDLVL